MSVSVERKEVPAHWGSCPKRTSAQKKRRKQFLLSVAQICFPSHPHRSSVSFFSLPPPPSIPLTRFCPGHPPSITHFLYFHQPQRFISISHHGRRRPGMFMIAPRRLCDLRAPPRISTPPLLPGMHNFMYHELTLNIC
jgi:hypothetical protein